MFQSLKDAKWWIIAGIIWAILTPPIIVYDPIRETIYYGMGYLMMFLFPLLPILWALLLLSIVWPGAPGSSEALIPAIILGVILGGLAGYLLYRIVKFFWPDKSRKDEEIYDIHIKDYKD